MLAVIFRLVMIEVVFIKFDRDFHMSNINLTNEMLCVKQESIEGRISKLESLLVNESHKNQLANHRELLAQQGHGTIS